MEITDQKINRIIELAKEYGAGKLILFGSILEDYTTAEDIDLASDIPGSKIYGFAAQIEDELHILVDIVPLTPRNRFIDSIIKKGKVIYEKTGSD
jgi:predicted nucleotidyltransferase